MRVIRSPFLRLHARRQASATDVTAPALLTHGKAGAASRAALRGACSPLALSVGCGMLFPLLGLIAMPAQAIDYYWDVNGATAGAGGPTPSGTWQAGGTTLSTDSTGATATGTVTTTTADRVFFSAGTDATGSYTVTVSGTQNIGRLTFQEGTVSVTRRHDQFRRRVRPDRRRRHAGHHLLRHCSGTGGAAFQRRHGHAERRSANTYTGTTQVGGVGAGPSLRDPGGARRERYQRESSADRRWQLHERRVRDAGRRQPDQ